MKPMKNPNGFGSVKKLGGRRRKPYTAVVTIGWEMSADETHQIQKVKYLGYYETKKEAMLALSQYNIDPLAFGSAATFDDVYNVWSEQHFKKISASNINGVKAAYKTCESLHKLKFSDLRLADLQRCVDNSGKNYPTLKKIKLLMSMMYKYAMQNDLVIKDYSKYVDIVQYKDKNPNKYDRHPFTDEEIDLLWKNYDNDTVQIALVLIYTGARINEILDLQIANINLDEQWFDIVASKTEAGIRRVPIADRILPIFKAHAESSSEYLFEMEPGRKWLYRNLYDAYWKPLMDKLGMDRTPHCARHSCVSMLKRAGVDDQIIRKIVGHSGKNVTEIVYTHFDTAQLLEAINKI